MTLESTVLKKLSEWRPAGSGRQALAIADEGSGYSAVVAADRADDLSCLAWEVSLRRCSGAVAAEVVGPWAERVASRVSGLGQPLKVVEVDQQRGEAQLRSEDPVTRGEQRYYYEVLLRGAGEALLRRYQIPTEPKQQRQQVAFPITHETLAQVTAELVVE